MKKKHALIIVSGVTIELKISDNTAEELLRSNVLDHSKILFIGETWDGDIFHINLRDISFIEILEDNE